MSDGKPDPVLITGQTSNYSISIQQKVRQGRVRLALEVRGQARHERSYSVDGSLYKLNVLTGVCTLDAGLTPFVDRPFEQAVLTSIEVGSLVGAITNHAYKPWLTTR